MTLLMIRELAERLATGTAPSISREVEAAVDEFLNESVYPIEDSLRESSPSKIEDNNGIETVSSVEDIFIVSDDFFSNVILTQIQRILPTLRPL